MLKLAAIGSLLCVMLVCASCRGVPEESMTQVDNGSFKILIRSQEFRHSGIRNRPLGRG